SLGVSRSTVRHALQRLEAEGVVVQLSGRRYAAGGRAGSDMAFEQVARDVRNALKRGEFGLGGRLPSETALAERHGVSRPTVRKALGLLRDERLVRSAPKLGWFVVGNGGRGGAR